MSAKAGWIIEGCAADATSVSLRRSERHVYRACVGGACLSCSMGHNVDYQTVFRGPDKRVSPRNGSDKHVSHFAPVGGNRDLSSMNREEVRKATKKGDADMVVDDLVLVKRQVKVI